MNVKDKGSRSMTGHTKLVEDLRDIEKTMFALGTSPINMDKISMYYAYDKGWGRTARDAADAIEELQVQVDALKKTLKAALKNSGINFGMWKEAQAEVERLLAQLPLEDESISKFADLESGKCWDLFNEKEVQE